MSKMNFSRADLNLLVVFDAVARSLSVTTAAEELFLSQPAVSHALNRLRQMLNDPLFVRGRGGLVPTPRAQECVGPVKEILQMCGLLLSPAVFDPSTARCRIRIAARDYSMITIIPAIVGQLRRMAPGVLLEVLPFGPASFGNLEDGSLDMSFWGSAPPGLPIEATELFHDRLVGLIGDAHPLAPKARQKTLTLSDYLAFPHVVVAVPNSRQSQIDEALAAHNLERKVGLVTPSFIANLAALRSSDLIMSLPSRLAKAAQSSTLVEFDLPLDVPSTAYHLIWHRRITADPAMRWIRNVIVEGARLPSIEN